jgi:hypothetical protein
MEHNAPCTFYVYLLVMCVCVRLTEREGGERERLPVVIALCSRKG